MRKAPAVAAVVAAGAAGVFFLLPDTSGVHLCPPDLCNGSVVISHPQPPGKLVLAFKVSPDGTRTIYVSNSNCRRELFSVATIGGPVVQLSDLPADCFRNVTDEISISPDGQFAAWESDRVRDQDYTLSTTPILGGNVVQVSPPLPADNDVERHKWLPDSSRLIFRAGKDATNRWELLSVPPRTVQHGPPSMYRISQAMGFSQAVHQEFQVGYTYVNYDADLETSGVYKGFTTQPLPGGAIFEEVFTDGFESGGMTKWN